MAIRSTITATGRNIIESMGIRSSTTASTAITESLQGLRSKSTLQNVIADQFPSSARGTCREVYWESIPLRHPVSSFHFNRILQRQDGENGAFHHGGNVNAVREIVID